MASSHALPQRRKTRIVCISDTHNQTPKLPSGDVLIHAGDLTNQGSYNEVKKVVEWLEKAPFEAKIVVAGNHEMTFDAPYYESIYTEHKWPERQDSEKCRRLLIDAPSITYLENERATIFLTSDKGPKTCFKVFGSPCVVNKRMAFWLPTEADAERNWAKIEDDVDIVISHTPARGVLDLCNNGMHLGCPALLQRLARIRPMMHVSGHVHEARGVHRVRWRDPSLGAWPSEPQPASLHESLIEAVEHWQDPGAGNKKLSFVDLTKKSGHRLENTGCLTRQIDSDSLRQLLGGKSGADVSNVECQPGTDKSNPTSSLENSALLENEAGRWRRTGGSAIECRPRSDFDGGFQMAVGESRAVEDEQREETVMINAAFVGPRTTGRPVPCWKPIVVDVDLAVWGSSAQ